MKGFGIYIKNDLLDPKHIENMGSAIWLYMWFLDKMTSISERGVGKILGGRPIKYMEIKSELGLSETTYYRWIDILREKGYINTIRTPYGLVVSVNKAEKVFRKRDLSKMTDLSPKNGGSDTKNGGSNKTIQLDNTVDNTEFLKKFLSYWNELFNTSYKTIEPLEENASYWLRFYTPEQMNEAASKIKDSDYWNGKMTPVIFFRRLNPRKEKVDYIGEMLNVKRKNGLSENYRVIKA